MGTLYGICVGLDPDIDFIEVSRPYVDKFLGSRNTAYTIALEKARVLAKALIDIPALLERVLIRTERGDLHIKMDAPDFKESMAQNTRALISLGWAMIFGFLLLASAYLLTQQYVWEARIGAGLSLVALLFMVLSRRKPGRRKAPHPPILVRRGSE